MSKLFNKSLWLYVITITGSILSFLAFYPGFMEFDSYNQYGQAIGKLTLNDWHPISMTLLWKILLQIYDGPQPMLLIQVIFYWWGFLYIALQLINYTGRFSLVLTVLIIPFLPFLMNFLGVIWKDTHLAIAFFCGTLLLCFGKISKTKLFLSLLFIFYGISVRHNGFIAALPLIFLWSYQFLQLTGLRIRVINNKYLSAIITISIVLGYLLLNVVLSSLITFEKENPLKSQMLNEIVFIQCNSNFPGSSILQNYYDEDLLKIAPNQRNNYLCNQVNLLAHTDDTNAIYENKILKEPETEDNNIKQLWVNNVIAYPSLYLKYRLIVYRTFLRPFDYDDTYYDFLEEQDKNPYSFKLSVEILNPFELNTILRKYLEFTTEHFSLFFRPFFWLITLTLTVLLSILKRNFIIFLVSISGLLYLIFYIPFLPAPDFRYAYYSIFPQTLAILSFLEQKFGLSLKNQSLI